MVAHSAKSLALGTVECWRKQICSPNSSGGSCGVASPVYLELRFTIKRRAHARERLR